FDFDTPEKKRNGLACVAALGIFCSVNVGFLPWLFGNGRRPLFSFTCKMITESLHEFSSSRIGIPIVLIWIVSVVFFLMRFLSKQEADPQKYFVLLVLFASVFNLLHPWLLDGYAILAEIFDL
ncbi:MAG: hypothetical protein J5828_03980, partial [Desulfovibrionaceae bacterium]|nr:hypothetical protein [Desulfovibrionaceae bacterium]